MSFIFVQKMSGIDTESIMGCKLVRLWFHPLFYPLFCPLYLNWVK